MGGLRTISADRLMAVSDLHVDYARNRLWVACFALLLAGLIAKISYENITGQTIFVSNNHSGMVPVPLAHLVGGVVGTGIGLEAISKKFFCSNSLLGARFKSSKYGSIPPV